MLIVGGIVGVLSYLMGIIPILAFGLSSLLIGFLILYLPESQESRGDNLATNLTLPLLLNIENLLEELELDERGIYLPASGLGISPKVFVPLAQTPATIRPSLGSDSSRKVFVTVGDGTEDRGILLDPPGASILISIEQMQKQDFAATQLKDAPMLLDAGLRNLGLAELSKFEQRNSTMVLEVKLRRLGELEKKLRNVAPKVVAQLGTPISSTVAAAVSKASGKYIRLKNTVLDSRESTLTVNLQLET